MLTLLSSSCSARLLPDANCLSSSRSFSLRSFSRRNFSLVVRSFAWASRSSSRSHCNYGNKGQCYNYVPIEKYYEVLIFFKCFSVSTLAFRAPRMFHKECDNMKLFCIQVYSKVSRKSHVIQKCINWRCFWISVDTIFTSSSMYHYWCTQASTQDIKLPDIHDESEWGVWLKMKCIYVQGNDG